MDRRKKLSPDDIRHIRMLRKQGMSHRKIGAVMGINHTTARYWTGDKARQNAKTIARLKDRVFDENRSKIQKSAYKHRQEVHGVEAVRKFQREYKRATNHLYPDYSVRCQNPLCPYKLNHIRSDGYRERYRYSKRIHSVCPKCKQ